MVVRLAAASSWQNSTGWIVVGMPNKEDPADATELDRLSRSIKLCAFIHGHHVSMGVPDWRHTDPDTMLPHNFRQTPSTTEQQCCSIRVHD